MEDAIENTTPLTKPADDNTKAIEDIDDFIFSESIGKLVSER